jgi:hypothetical protein
MKKVLTGIVIAWLIMACAFERNDGIAFFFMSLLVIAVSVLSFTSSELRNARTVAVSSFLF